MPHGCLSSRPTVITDIIKKITAMKIGIIVAMDKELDLLLHELEGHGTVTANDIVFHTGTIGSREVVAMQCGIGKVNAAIGTLTLIDTFHPALVINTGIAGGTGATSILDIVVASEVAYHDVWCGPGTIPGQAAGCPLMLPCAFDKEKLSAIAGAKFGPIISGDIFVSRPEEVEHILSMYPNALAVDMESAAIAQVCYLKNLPFICMRVISDTPGAEDHLSQYENFWSDAPKHTFEALNALLATL